MMSVDHRLFSSRSATGGPLPSRSRMSDLERPTPLPPEASQSFSDPLDWRRLLLLVRRRTTPGKMFGGRCPAWDGLSGKV